MANGNGPNDPYAEFGGAAAANSEADPYAEFGGKANATQTTPTATISARESNWSHPLNYLEDLAGDLRFGGETTLPGRILHKMGAQGLDRGVPESVGETVGGPVIGPVNTAHGILTAGHGVGTGRGKEIIRGMNETGWRSRTTLAPVIGVTNPEFLPSLATYGTAQKAIDTGAQALGGIQKLPSLSAILALSQSLE